MTDHARLDPYKRPRYEQGIDAKIVVMGNTGVGKTSLLQRYTQNKFDPKNTTSTTGAFFVTKKVHVDGLKVRLQLWDTAGQERFRSMAPMYYRGANAALLLYDITNSSTFEDVRGWLEELRKNCTAELIIYIVGSKADLHRHRQVTSDRARLSLHRWFPPPRSPSPPPPPQPSTLSYIRPRFTSFTPSRSVPPNSLSPMAQDDNIISRGAGLKRSITHSAVSFSAETSPRLARSNSTNTAVPPRPKKPHERPAQGSKFGRFFGPPMAWNELGDSSSNSLPEEEEDDEDTVDDREWGLDKGMSLYEVSAKDDSGIKTLFDNLISAIIARKDSIEKENEQKRRDSVFLSPVTTPTWEAVADEEEKAQSQSVASWSCCQI
ncbi:ras-domain-containing protein [Rickenella mellea]|uniref:Ras-domain-containing protein n=1 Tax=Rickenella mellea TaxID=50990 RepID=A0A4R5XG41_9AGAM|nr:ras-domain-containing protein [Rickenella mellea]